VIRTDRAVREILGLSGEEGGGPYRRVVTDSRGAAEGDLFVALAGERFDGHAFLEAAREAGVRGAVVRRGTPALAGMTLYPVDDTLVGLGRLAKARRAEVAGPVIAVTGTNGKTSTKEMLAAAVATRYRVHATRANLNNLVGVPTTILEAPGDTEALVVEAGANLPGEIARYREIIAPDVVVITNVGTGHLEGFGSIAGVMREKLSLAVGAPVAVVGTDSPELAEGARRLARRVVTAGLAGADVVPDSVQVGDDGRAEVVFDGHRFRLGPLGYHQAANAALVWAVARELDLPRAGVAAALAAVELPGSRGQLRHYGALAVFNDSYNANPGSFVAAIETARRLKAGRRLVFVAGSMLELGPESARLHREIAERLVELGPDLLVAVGDFGPALEPMRPRLRDRLIVASDAEAAAAMVAPRLTGSELIVLKGSRGVALERMLPRLVGPSA